MSREEQIASIVLATVEAGSAPTFDALFLAVERRLPDVTATEVDQVARPYEAGEPGALRYVVPVVPAAPPTQLALCPA